MTTVPRASMHALPLAALVAALGGLAAGCSTPVGKYFARRGADLGDCVHAEIGLGWPAAPFLFPKATGYAMEPGGEAIPVPGRKPRWRQLLKPHLYIRMKLTDFFVLGNGYSQPVSTGWRGRYRQAGQAVSLDAGLPIYRNHEEGSGTSVHTEWAVLTKRTYDSTPPGRGGMVAERSWAGISATLLVAFRLDFNLVELTDFLVNVAKLVSVPGNFAGRITYHDSCTGLRSLGIKAQPRALLAKLSGVDLQEMNGAEECCGFGGTFSVKFGEVSAAIAERKCNNACATGASAIVGGDLGCLLNIEGKLRRMGDTQTRVMHIAEVLAAKE